MLATATIALASLMPMADTPNEDVPAILVEYLVTTDEFTPLCESRAELAGIFDEFGMYDLFLAPLDGDGFSVVDSYFIVIMESDGLRLTNEARIVLASALADCR